MDQLKALVKEVPHTKYFNEYNKFYFLVTGKKNNSTCSKCSIKRIYGILIRYVNNLN